MLIIRNEQMDAFDKFAFENFKDEMVAHVKGFAPIRCGDINDDAIRQIINTGIDRAKGYGLTARGPVILFIEMMFLFGNRFDTDPQYGWAGEILRETSEGIDEMGRADLLYTSGADFLSKVTCFENRQRALRQLESMNLKTVLTSTETHRDSFVDKISHLLHRVFPEKHDYSGDSAIRELVQEAVKTADYHISPVDWGSVLFSVMMFLLGHGCFSDPQFPWVREALHSGDSDCQQIANLLYAKMNLHMNKLMLK